MSSNIDFFYAPQQRNTSQRLNFRSFPTKFQNKLLAENRADMKKNLLPVLLLLFVTACTFTQKIKDGPTAFERNIYKLAVDLLCKEYIIAISRFDI